MTVSASLAIFVLFWVMTAFVVLPFGVRTPHEASTELVPGQAESAPVNFNPKRVLLITTLVALILFGLFYANYVYGWITTDMFQIF